MKLSTATAFLALMLASSAPLAQQGPGSDSARIEAFKTSVTNGVEARRKLAQVMTDTVFSFGELAYQEFETSKYLTDLLEKNGFAVERDIAGMPTAWVARWGSGRPIIALGSDIDCLPKANQKPGVAYRDEIVPGAPGHGEGHNSGQAVNIVAALAVKELMEREKLSGTLMIWPGVAEELLGGKAYMVRAGIFKDVDVVLYTHVGDNFSTSWGKANGTGMVSVEYTFQGESAHAAGRPWRGRNALRAVELMNIGWDLNREQLRPEQRSHYVITNGGDQPNVIPSLASVWYFFREMDFENIKKNYETGNRIAQAAAMMTNTTVTRKLVGTAAPRHFNKTIAEVMQSNIDRVGLPTWTEEEQTFAKAVQKVANGNQDGLATKMRGLRPPAENPESGGSDDIGNVSWVAPTAPLFYPANIPNLPGHNWANAIAMATPIAHKGVVAGSKVMALSVVDFLTRPELVQAAKTYFTDVQLKSDKPEEFLAESDVPQVQINRETMARFRPEMRKFYYDASKYETYLDQLGVKFPTLAKTQ
jgi:aminobenzoyl-glutamate utilization protein B